MQAQANHFQVCQGQLWASPTPVVSPSFSQPVPSLQLASCGHFVASPWAGFVHPPCIPCSFKLLRYQAKLRRLLRIALPLKPSASELRTLVNQTIGGPWS